MLGSLADLQRRPLRPCLFLAAWFEAKPATVEALALELGLGPANRRKPEAGLRRSTLPWLCLMW